MSETVRNEIEHRDNMQTVHIHGAPISGSASVGNHSQKLSGARGSDEFAHYFKAAGPLAPPTKDGAHAESFDGDVSEAESAQTEVGQSDAVDAVANELFDQENGLSLEFSAGSPNDAPLIKQNDPFGHNSETKKVSPFGAQKSESSAATDDSPQHSPLETSILSGNTVTPIPAIQSQEIAGDLDPHQTQSATIRSWPASEGGATQRAETSTPAVWPTEAADRKEMPVGSQVVKPDQAKTGPQTNSLSAPVAAKSLAWTLVTEGDGGQGVADVRATSNGSPHNGSVKAGNLMSDSSAGQVAQNPVGAALLPGSQTRAVENWKISGRSGVSEISESPVYGRAESDALPIRTRMRLPDDSKAMSSDRVGFAQNGMTSAPVLQVGPDTAFLTQDIEAADAAAASLQETALQTGSTRAFEAMIARPETARMVVAQLANALNGAQGNKVEITLNPEELGRVRMVLSITENGVAVSITAERPEILDMMRRHIDQLAEEFRSLGYDEFGFEFAEGDAQGGFDTETAESEPDNSTESSNRRDTSESDPVPIVRATQSRGLDLRV